MPAPAKDDPLYETIGNVITLRQRLNATPLGNGMVNVEVAKSLALIEKRLTEVLTILLVYRDAEDCDPALLAAIVNTVGRLSEAFHEVVKEYKVAVGIVG